MLPSDVFPFVDGTALDPPVPEGVVEAAGAAAFGVSLEDSAGEPSGEATGGSSGAPTPAAVGALATALHWLIGGVFTLQALGSAMARVWLMVMPNTGAAPFMTEQRHRGDAWTTLASWEQHEDEGVDEFPVMKLRHGARLVRVVVHPDWAADRGHIAAASTRTRPIMIPLDAMSLVLLDYDLDLMMIGSKDFEVARTD